MQQAQKRNFENKVGRKIAPELTNSNTVEKKRTKENANLKRNVDTPLFKGAKESPIVKPTSGKRKATSSSSDSDASYEV